MNLSIVIPAFNECGKIGYDVESACEFLQGNGFQGEVIVADDGSRDTTADETKKVGDKYRNRVNVKVIRNQQHRGKGYAVRSGIMQTTGDYVMFADSGSCVPFDNALRGLEQLKAGKCDIANGSRRLAGAHLIKDQGPYRHICSAIFHWFVIRIMKLPTQLTDTQCGFKIYRGDIARLLYGKCVIDGFMFDIEIIRRAINQHYRIAEFPIDWTCDPDSRLSPTRSFWRILSELLKIRKAT
ncbi:MAG: glycosyltransferase [Sedimentisphaerales bacterium]|jgi:dolichyl-phosphate beta-glucosyltransferase